MGETPCLSYLSPGFPPPTKDACHHVKKRKSTSRVETPIVGGRRKRRPSKKWEESHSSPSRFLESLFSVSQIPPYTPSLDFAFARDIVGDAPQVRRIESTRLPASLVQGKGERDAINWRGMAKRLLSPFVRSK